MAVAGAVRFAPGADLPLANEASGCASRGRLNSVKSGRWCGAARLLTKQGRGAVNFESRAGLICLKVTAEVLS